MDKITRNLLYQVYTESEINPMERLSVMTGRIRLDLEEKGFNIKTVNATKTRKQQEISMTV
jgi:hypothetical protein